MKNYSIKYRCLLTFQSLLTIISPVLNTKFCYWIKFRRQLDLSNPVTSNEKILWLKLNYYSKNPLIKQCADKCEVRKYIRECGCEEILINTLGIYDSPYDIPFDKLPKKFVIKSNYGCGLNLICQDKSKLDIAHTLTQLEKWKSDRQHLQHSEMQYAGIKRRYLVEEFLDNGGKSPDDYKLYCCNGKAHYAMVCIGRENGGHAKFYYFDRQGKLQRQLSQDGIDAPKDFTYIIPNGWDKMFEYAERLTKPFPFVRCDFYIVNGQVYFGELTFTPCAGLDNEKLAIADKLIGDLITLPQQN